MKEWVCKEYTTTMLNGNVFGGLQKEQELVRCKDCKYGYISEFAPPEMRDIWCCARNHILSTVKPDFFCADGERRTDDA